MSRTNINFYLIYELPMLHREYLDMLVLLASPVRNFKYFYPDSVLPIHKNIETVLLIASYRY